MNLPYVIVSDGEEKTKDTVSHDENRYTACGKASESHTSRWAHF